MIVLKEDKELYTFLDIVYKVFGDKSGRKVLFGDENNHLLFYAEDYAGDFYHEEYQFIDDCYSLGKTPEGNYVIESAGTFGVLERGAQERINKLIKTSHRRLELAKANDYIIAKTVAETGFWLKDDDLKLITKFKFFWVCVPSKQEDVLVITNEAINYKSSIIFNFNLTNSKEPTQISFDTAEEIEKQVVVISSKEEFEALNADVEEQELDNLMQEAEEEEDEFDPMA